METQPIELICPVCKKTDRVEYKEIEAPFTTMTVIGHGVDIIDSYYKCRRCGIRFDEPESEE